ncbi:MAG: hypothetical protein EBV10_11160 [Synechococcaceae bacterium WB6_1A_059]|nr:hypothetical protein [Synechococcaceae bacterium WB6_1A_059]
MSYVDAIWDRDEDLIRVVERHPTKGRLYQEYQARYIFYYPDSRGKYKSIFGENLNRVVSKSHKEFQKEQRIHNNQRLYESDINPIFRTLAENYLGVDAPKLHTAFFDIEVDFDPERGYASPDDPFMPITAISVHLQWLDTLVTLVLPPKTLTVERAQELVKDFPNTHIFDNEGDMLETFLQLIEDADVLSGWNSEGYDIPYTVNRVTRVLSKEDTRRFCLWNQFPKKREYERFGRTATTYDLVGRVHLDSLELYRKYTYEERHTYRLDAIGEMEIGERKTVYEGTLDQLYAIEYDFVMNQDRANDITIEWENGETSIMSGAEIYELIYNSNKPWMLSANGTIFTYETEGVIPGLLERWYKERKEMQAKLKDAINAGNKIEEEYWDKRQLVKKINLNSLYGAILNAGCRFFDKRIGQSTTLTGRSIARHMASKVNEVITGEYDHVGKSIIYGDTDSCYFSAYTTLKLDIDKKLIPWDRDVVIQLYNQVADTVNKTFPDFMQDAFHCPKSRGEVIKAGREIVASKGLFITKKRYAVLYYDKEGKRLDVDGKPGKIKAMGLDLKRSDTPEFMQDFLSEVLEKVLNGGEEKEILEMITEFRTEFKARPGWEKGSPKRANNITEYEEKERKQGKANLPGHVRASINWNTLRRMNGDKYSMQIVDGMKVIVCKLKDNALGYTSVAYPTDELRLPRWFQDLPFDHSEMEATIINNKLDNLIGVLEWDLESTTQNNVFNNLFSFQ